MSKLVFIYGTMGSAKSANILMQYFELKKNNKEVILLKSSIDTRDENFIRSRIGLEQKVTCTFDKEKSLCDLYYNYGSPKFILVDEAQFCSEKQITELKDLTINHDVNIYCYGLSTDFTSHLFEGSKRLFEVADEFKKLEMQCLICGDEASINARIGKDNKVITKGAQIEIGSNDKYMALCYKCWKEKNNDSDAYTKESTTSVRRKVECLYPFFQNSNAHTLSGMNYWIRELK